MTWSKISQDFITTSDLLDLNALYKKPSKLLQYHLKNIRQFPYEQATPLQQKTQDLIRATLIELWEDQNKLSNYHMLKWAGRDSKASTEHVNAALKGFFQELRSLNSFDIPEIKYKKANKTETLIKKIKKKEPILEIDQETCQFFEMQDIPVDLIDEKNGFEINKFQYAKKFRGWRNALLANNWKGNFKIGLTKNQMLIFDWLVWDNALTEHGEILSWVDEDITPKEMLELYLFVRPLQCEDIEREINQYLIIKYGDELNDLLELSLSKQDPLLSMQTIERLNQTLKGAHLRCDPKNFTFQMVADRWDKNMAQLLQSYLPYLSGIVLNSEKAIQGFIDTTKEFDFAKIRSLSLPFLSNPKLFEKLCERLPHIENCLVNQVLLKNLDPQNSFPKLELKTLQLCFLEESNENLGWNLPKQLDQLFPCKPKLFFLSGGLKHTEESLNQYMQSFYRKGLSKDLHANPIFGFEGAVLTPLVGPEIYFHEAERGIHYTKNHHPLTLQYAEKVSLESTLPEDDQVYPQVKEVKITSLDLREIVDLGKRFPHAKFLDFDASVQGIENSDEIIAEFQKNWKELTHINYVNKNTVTITVQELSRFFPPSLQKAFLPSSTTTTNGVFIPNHQREIFISHPILGYKRTWGNSPDEYFLSFAIKTTPIDPNNFLKVFNEPISDTVLEAICSKRPPYDWEELELKRGNFSDTQARKISRFTHLRSLTFENCQGMGKLTLNAFCQLTNLDRLDLTGTRISKEDLDTLKEALPQCEIIASAKNSKETKLEEVNTETTSFLE